MNDEMFLGVLFAAFIVIDIILYLFLTIEIIDILSDRYENYKIHKLIKERDFYANHAMQLSK